MKNVKNTHMMEWVLLLIISLLLILTPWEKTDLSELSNIKKNVNKEIVNKNREMYTSKELSYILLTQTNVAPKDILMPDQRYVKYSKKEISDFIYKYNSTEKYEDDFFDCNSFSLQLHAELRKTFKGIMAGQIWYSINGYRHATNFCIIDGQFTMIEPQSKQKNKFFNYTKDMQVLKIIL